MKLYRDAEDFGDDLGHLLDTGGEVRAVYEVGVDYGAAASAVAFAAFGVDDPAETGYEKECMEDAVAIVNAALKDVT